jgi:hypothetical protein
MQRRRSSRTSEPPTFGVGWERPNTVKDRARFEAAVITGTIRSKTAQQRHREEVAHEKAVKVHEKEAARLARGLPRRSSPLPLIIEPTTEKVERKILGGLPVGSITAKTATDWVKSLTKDGVSPVTVNKWWGYLHQTLKSRQEAADDPRSAHRGTVPAHPRDTRRGEEAALLPHVLREMIELALPARPHEALLIETLHRRRLGRSGSFPSVRRSSSR